MSTFDIRPIPGSPEWWLARLEAELNGRQANIRKFTCYYEGDHPLPNAPAKARQAFLELMEEARSNWMELVVNAVAERLKVQGFRLGSQQAADGPAWGMWQANNLDSGSTLVHLEALICGESYVTVWDNPDDPSVPLITPEHPSQVVVALDAADRRRRAAALKRWTTEDGLDYATLYLPDRIYKYQRRAGASPLPVTVVAPGVTDPSGITPFGVAPFGFMSWEPRASEGADWTFENPYGVVPVVPFRNKARMLRSGRSELYGLTPIQDRINTTIFNRLMAQEFSAFRQKWATGMDIPVDPATQQPVEPFDSAVDRLWISENPDTKFGDFSETDLNGYIKATEADVQHLAAISRTPPHYLLGQSGAFPSGESLKSTETGLVAKVMDRQTGFAESWEEVVSLGFRVVGDDTRADVRDAEVIWRNPESRTEGELVDALVKMAPLGVPNEALWERWGASPQEIARWKAMGRQEQLRLAVEQAAAGVAGAANGTQPAPDGRLPVPVGGPPNGNGVAPR